LGVQAEANGEAGIHPQITLEARGKL